MEILEIVFCRMKSRERKFFENTWNIKVILRNDLSVSLPQAVQEWRSDFQKTKPVYHFAFDIPKKSTFGHCVDRQWNEILEVIHQIKLPIL
jgi:hypothetical protein